MQLSSLGYYSTAPLVGSGVALVVALVGAIAAVFLFLNPKNKDRYTGFMQRLSAHLNFERFLLSSILKFLYAFGVLYCVVYGLVLLFSGSVLTGIATAVLAPVALRVAFEQLMLLFAIREETAETNALLRRMQGGAPQQGTGRPQQPVPPSAPRYDSRSAVHPNANAGYGYAAPQQPQQPRQTPGDATRRYAPVRPGEYQNAPRQGYPTGYARPDAAPARPAETAARPPQQGGTPGTP